MAYDFLGLVNDVNRRLNEVELSTSNFATASGFYASAKEAVNAAIRQINYQAYEWPFNHVTQEEFLLAGTSRYTFPSDVKTVDMNTFRIKKDVALGNETSHLSVLQYEDYLDKYIDSEYNYTNANSGVPRLVSRTPNMEFTLVPTPDKDYELVYEYYRLPFDMILHNDIPTIPEVFRSIIVDGAMHYAYLFRGNSQDAASTQDKFMNGIKQMRSIFINRTDYVRTTVIDRNGNRGSNTRIR